jgi:NAD(P)-dependent dehydrogenase (short-subunit alcohol dehydrogenase family)
LEEKRVLITGGASGIGRATALLMSAEGARVAVTDVNARGADAVADEIRSTGGDAAAWALNVADEERWLAVLPEVEARWGGLDVLVAGAGIGVGKPVTEISLAEWRGLMAVNLDGVFLAVKHSLPYLRKSTGGNIVILSSVAGIRGFAGSSAYSASKGALRLFAKSVALECAQAGDGVRVNSVHPGGVETPIWQALPMWGRLVAEYGEEGAFRALASAVPFKRFAKPEEIARGIVYLASDAASYVTGSELVIDGGATA